MKKGQVAMEFIIIAMITFILILSGAYVFRSYVFQSNDKVINTKLSALATDVLAQARKMYYYGPPSKSVVTVEMPPKIHNMYVFANPANNEYYLVFKVISSSGEHEFYYDSDIPLRGAHQGICSEDPSSVCYYFPERIYSEGFKKIKTQATQDCLAGINCVLIEEVQ